MSVVVSMEDLGSCVKRFMIEVPAPTVEAETGRVLEKVRKKASVPGFRKGKVPKSLVLQRFRGDVEKGLVDHLVPRYWDQAAKEKEVKALLKPQFKIESLEPGRSLVFSATFEVRPAFELGNISTFDLPDLDTEPRSETVEKAVADLRFQAGTWREVGRPAAHGDQVEGVLQDVTGEPGPEQPICVELGGSDVWEELSLAVVGATKGREVTFERGSRDETRTFKVVVSAIRERELPELDDAFAKSLSSELGSVAALEEQVKEQLRVNLEAEHRMQKEAAVLDQLRRRHSFELPERVVGLEIESMLREYAETLVRQGVDVENADIEWQKMGEKIRPQAERRVASRFLLDAVAAKEGLEIDEAEVEATLAAIGRAERKSAHAIRDALDRAGRLDRLRGDLLRKRTLRLLLGEETKAPSEP